uniref:ZZ-type domain-containing protein n=1 Tax=Caenorhabditis tropicalis TaxID=1561998 RepID=A0A1I7UE11_9PELO
MEEELKLVPSNLRHGIKPKSGEVTNMQRLIQSGGAIVTSKVVYVTYYTQSGSTTVATCLSLRDAWREIRDKAAEILPTVPWKFFSGNALHSQYEFVSNEQVWNAICSARYYNFEYLEVRLERAVNKQNANCDNCHTSITGHRFKCLECSDFDICSSCEGRSAHAEHAMLRIVGPERTHIPIWVRERIRI